MKTLFNEDGRYSMDANAIEYKATAYLRPMFKFYVQEGYSPREISHLIMLASLTIEMEELL